jgi:hypothetical protein
MSGAVCTGAESAGMYVKLHRTKIKGMSSKSVKNILFFICITFLFRSIHRIYTGLYSMSDLKPLFNTSAEPNPPAPGAFSERASNRQDFTA